MTRALFSAPRPLTWADCLVVQFEEVVVAPASRVIVDHSLRHLIVVVFELHEDATILFVVCESSFNLELFGPKLTVVTPSTSEGVSSMRVSHPDKSDTIAESNNAQSSVGMAIVEAIIVCVRVTCATGSASLNSVVFSIMLRERSPKVINCDISVTNVLSRCSRNSSN